MMFGTIDFIQPRNIHDHSPLHRKGLQGLPIKNGGFLRFFRGTFKRQGISGLISGASSNSRFFRDLRGRKY